MRFRCPLAPVLGSRFRLCFRQFTPALCVAASCLSAQAQELPLSIGPDDFRVSNVGPEQDTSYAADFFHPVVEIHPDEPRGLIFWSAPTTGDALSKIWVRTVELDGSFSLGPENQVAPIGWEPSAACDWGRSRCLVWFRTLPLANESGDYRLASVWVDATSGQWLADGQRSTFAAENVSYVELLYEPESDEYLRIENYEEGCCQRIRIRRGIDDLPADPTRPDHSPTNSYRIRATYDTRRDDYLLVWTEQDADSEWTIRAGYYEDEFAGNIPSLRLDPDSFFGSADYADIAHDPLTGRSLVVWVADDFGASVAGEYEVYGRYLEWNETSAALVASGLFQISNVGDDGDQFRDAALPAVAFDRASRRFVVVWSADDDDYGLANSEFEIFAQGYDSEGTPIRNVPLRVSRMGGPDIAGGTGDGTWDATLPAVAAGSGRGLVAWWGSNQVFPIFFGDSWTEREIWGQWLDLGLIFADGFESGSTSRW